MQDSFVELEDSIILMFAQKSLDQKSHLVLLNMATKKVTEVTHPKLVNLALPNICKVEENFYFISGGYDRNTNEVRKESYFYNTKTGKLYQQPNTPTKIYDTFTIRRGNSIYLIGGRSDPKDHSDIMSSFYTFSLVEKTWTKLPDIPTVITGIKMIFLDYQDNLVMFLHKGFILKYDFKKQFWSNVKKLYYNFRRFYISKNGRGFLFNEVNGIMYEYDFYNDQIVTFLDLSDRHITDHFYVEEEDKIYFLDNAEKNGQFMLDLVTENLIFQDYSLYKDMWGDFQGFRAFSNCTLKTKENAPVEEGSNNFYMFGNENYPMKICVDRITAEVSIKSIPESLQLKTKQIVKRCNEKYIVFMGGKIHNSITRSWQIYDLDDNSVTEIKNISQNVVEGFIFERSIDGQMYLGVMSNDVFQVIPEKNEEQWIQKQCVPSSVYIPNVLDDEEKLTAFTLTTKKKIPYLIFSEYHMDKDEWQEIFQQQIQVNVSLSFCETIGNHSYLVIATKEDGEYFYEMTVEKKDNQISNVQLNELCKISDSSSIMNVPQIINISTSLKLIQFVDLGHNLVTKFFNRETKQMEENDFTKKYRENLLEQFRKKNMEKKFDQFENFCMVDQ